MAKNVKPKTVEQQKKQATENAVWSFITVCIGFIGAAFLGWLGAHVPQNDAITNKWLSVAILGIAAMVMIWLACFMLVEAFKELVKYAKLVFDEKETAKEPTTPSN